MKAYRTDYQGNPNIGLFIFCNDKVCIVGRGFNKKQVEDIEKVMGVPVYQMSMVGTELIGLFITGNNKTIIAPAIMYSTEKKILKEICEKNNLRLEIINTKLTALGNNILCNDSGCIINHEFEEDSKIQIRDVFGNEHGTVLFGTISCLDIVGSLAASTNKGALVSPEIEDKELEILEKLLKCKVVKGNINGTPYVRSGLVANSNGVIVSEYSLGDEALNIKEAFD